MNIRKITAALVFTCCVCAAFAQAEKPDALKLYNQGNYRDAIAVCETELASNPNNLDSYSVLCWALIANGQYMEAETRAQDARRINSFDVRIIEVLGEAKYYLGKLDDALSLFQRYVSSVPENAGRLGKVYYLMGEIYIKQARYEHADISLTMAVRIERNTASWWARLGYAREMTKSYASAIAAYDQALVLNPQLSDASRGKTRCQSHIR